MVTSVLKPSVQRIVDVRDDIKQQLVHERSVRSPNDAIVARLETDVQQLTDMLGHLERRIPISKEYVYNMTDLVLGVLRQYLEDELSAMLRSGKNESNRDYIRVDRELGVVKAEKDTRTDDPSV